MNTLLKLSLLAIAVTSITACNEKVSPELQGGNASSGSSSSGGGPVVVPDQYYFRVVNASDTMLNYKVHKTGTGNANSKCEMTSATAMSSDLFRAAPSTFDITCFYEAEELSMNFNGFAFSIEASPNTCQYVGYGPFSYYDRVPGTSSQSLLRIECNEDAPPSQAQIDGLGAAYVGMGCDSYRNSTVNSSGSFAKDTDQLLCRFDYTNVGGPNCDPGIITISGFSLTQIDTDNDGNPDSLGPPVPISRTVNCGGKPSACIDGPFVNEGFNVNSTSGIKVGPTVLNTAFTKTYTYGSLFDIYYSNRKYVNYRRDLASLNIEYGNSNRNAGTTQLTAAYMSAFSDPLYKNVFNPELMSMYSDNKRMDGTPLATPAQQTAASDIYGDVDGDGTADYAARPLAAEPFVGMTGYKTNAFYTMYCFDNAFDVKGRVRMVVRDWDRVFSGSPTDTAFERIADVDLLPPLARQDVPYTDEVTGDPDSWNAFNDMHDWDDLIDMERDDSGAPYDPSITIWRTYPNAPYTAAGTNGLFNPVWFPAEKQ
ncbi:MAG: hypothetical protein ACJ76H_03710 [Bacteriovoracaceae bacterium]